MSVSDEVKSRVDIVELVSRYVQLQRAGRTYKACCPFHDERTPSFVVFPETGTWHCFGSCGTGGDAFSFLMKRENLDFKEALQVLAQETGVELSTSQPDQTDRRRAQLFDINAAAALYFQDILRNHQAAAPARSYLERRGIDRSTEESFQLGFALESWDALGNFLNSRGYGRDLQVEAGLLKHNEERNSTYDAFRNRLIIPIRDRQGRVIGFGGRVLGDGVPKYLNTSETPLFHKSSVIYGLDLAYKAVRQEEQVVIVEGYMDVIAAHQYGHANVVACMGTALTPDQLRQLQRYTHNFILAMDSDAAGQQATLRGLNQARQALTRVSKPTIAPGGRIRMEQRLGANLRIAAMPVGKDPDELIRRDPDLWTQVVADAQPLVDFYFDVVARQYDLSTARGKGLTVAELAPLIAELGDNIERQHYVQQLSRLVQVDEQTITNQVSAAARTARARQESRQRGQPASRPASPPPGRPKTVPPKGGMPKAGPGSSSRRGGQDGPDLGPPPDFPEDMLPEMPPPELGDWSEPDGTWPDGTWPDGDGAPTPSVVPRPSARGRQRPPGPPAQTWGRPLMRSQQQEEYLLSILLLEPELLIRMAALTHQKDMTPLRTDDWQDAENQAVFMALKQFIVSDEPWDLELFQETLTSHLHERLARLVTISTRLPDRTLPALEEAALKALLRMRLGRLKADLDAITFMLNEVQRSGDRSATLEYSLSINRHRRERYHLERVLSELSKMSLA